MLSDNPGEIEKAILTQGNLMNHHFFAIGIP